MTYTNPKQTPLKWHRFVQFIVLPVIILSSGYILVSMFAEVTGLRLPTPRFFAPVLTYFHTDIFALGDLFWPVVAVLAGVFLIFLLAVSAWIGFFSWRTYSRFCWYLLVILLLGVVAALFCGVNLYGVSTGLAASYLQIFLGIHSVSERGITIFRIVIILLLALQIVFTILNLFYYFRRRRLFSSSAEYEDDEDAPVPVVQAAVKKPEPVPAETQTPEEEWDEYFSEALKNLSEVEYVLDHFLEAGIEEKVDIIIDYGKKVKEYEGRIKQYRSIETEGT